MNLIPGSGRSPWRRAWQATPIFLPGESHGQAVHRVTKIQTQLKQLSMHTCMQSNVKLFFWPSGFSCVLLFSHSVMSNSLWPHELQHARLPCLLLSPGVCSNSCPLSRWCHPTIFILILCFSFFLLPSTFPSIRVFSNESVFHITWQKYWNLSFSINYSWLISFRIDWFDLLTLQRNQSLL